MKLLFCLLSTFIFIFSYSQTVESIDQMKTRIDGLQFTDTVYSNDTVYDLRSKEREITGYLKDDTLLKTIARFRNSSRVRVSYYGPQRYFQTDGDPMYVRDYDDSTGKLLAEVWGCKDYLELFDTVLKASIPFPMFDDERKGNMLLARGDLHYDIRYKQVDAKAKKYDFIAEVIEDIQNVIGGDCCHNDALKFHVLQSSDSFYLDKSIYLAIPNFSKGLVPVFRKGKQFKIHAATNDGHGNSPLRFLGQKDIFKDKLENLPILFVRDFQLYNGNN